MAASAAAAVMARQERYLRAFERAGATEPSRARTLAELGLSDSRPFQTLVRRGYVIAASPGLYYVDADRVRRRRLRARLAFVIALAVLATVVAIGAFQGAFH